MFRTAGTAEDGGSAVFTSVQELAGTGGLETHATEKSLWAAAAQAGVVDVDRWVVAAVLWQVTDAAATANACDVRPSRFWLQGSTQAATAAGQGLEGGSPDNHAVVLAEATSLWKELRDEAFLSVVGRSTRGSRDQGATPIAEAGPSSTALGPPSPTPRGQENKQQDESLVLGRGASEDGDDAGTGQHPRRRYSALQSDSSSFDVALMHTLALAGRGDVGQGLGAAARAGAVTKRGTAKPGSGCLECVEDILLHNFAIAGFADGSCLGVSDIVAAVSVRRQRVLSATAASGGRRSSRGIAEKSAENLPRSMKNQQHPVGSPRLGEPSGGVRQCSLPSTEQTRGEAGATRQVVRREKDTSEGDGDPTASAGDSPVGMPMEPSVEARVVAGIPIELRELFRAAALAKMLRQQQQQQQQKGRPKVRKQQGPLALAVIGTALACAS